MIDSVPFLALNTLVFNDAFGTTRLTLPKKVKTVRDCSQASSGCLQQLDSGVVISGVDFSSRSRICELPSMKSTSVRYIHAWEYGFSADGAYVYRLDERETDGAHAMQIYRFEPGQLSERSLVNRHPFALGELSAAIPALPAASIGGDRRLELHFQHVWPDGRFVKSARGALLCGHITQSGCRMDWVRPITHDLDPLRIELRAAGEAIWILGETQGGGQAVLARVDPHGELRSWRFEAAEAPGYCQGWVGLRTDRTTFQRFRLEAPDQRESFIIPSELLSLEGGVDPDALRHGNPLPRSAAPDERGRVMMLGEQLIYLPWHAETLINVTTPLAKDRLIPRKLPPAQLDARSFFSRYSARLRAAGYALGGSVQPARLWLKSSGRGKKKLTLRHHTSGPATGFAGMCLSGVMRQSQVNYKLSHFGWLDTRLYPGVWHTRSHPATAEEVRAGLALLAEHGQSALDLVGVIASELENSVSIDTQLSPEARPIVADAIRAAQRADGPEAPEPYAFRTEDPLRVVLETLEG